MSITQDFNNRSDKGQSFTSFKKTWVDSSKTVAAAPVVEPTQTYTQKVDAAIAEGEANKKIVATADKATPKVAITPVNVAGLQNNPVTGQTPVETTPIWEQKDMTRDEYIAQNNANQQGEFDTQLQAGEVFDPYAALQGRQIEGVEGSVSGAIQAGKADAIRNQTMENVGDMPQPTDTTGMTPEEAQAAQVSDAQNLADWWRKVGEESQRQLGDVSTQVADVTNKMDTYQSAIDKMLANINTVNPEVGTALSSVFSEIKQSGDGTVTPEALAKIQQLGSSDLSPAEIKAQANAILHAPNPSVLNQAGVTDTGTGYTLSNGVTFKKGADGLPDYSGEALPADASAADLALMQYATSNKIVDVGTAQQARLLKSLSEETARAKAAAEQEVRNIFDTASNKVDEAMLSAMNNMKYQDAKLSLEKDISLENILTEEAKMEGYLKGQMEAWGAEGGSAALTVMSNSKNKFLTQYSQTKQGYDIELANLSNLQTEASMAYTNRTIEIANAKALGIQKINNDNLENLNNIFNKTSELYENRDLKVMQNGLDYSQTLIGINQAAQEAQYEAEQDTKKFNLDLMKEYSSNKYDYTIEPDGSIKLTLDENGRPVPVSKTGGSSSSSYSGYGQPEYPTTYDSAFMQSIKATTELGKGEDTGTFQPIPVTGRTVTERKIRDYSNQIAQMMLAGKTDAQIFKEYGNNDTARQAKRLAEEVLNAQKMSRPSQANAIWNDVGLNDYTEESIKNAKDEVIDMLVTEGNLSTQEAESIYNEKAGIKPDTKKVSSSELNF